MPDMGRGVLAIHIKRPDTNHRIADLLGLTAKYLSHDLMPETDPKQRFFRLFSGYQEVA